MTSSNPGNQDLGLKLVTSRIFRCFGYATWVEVDYFVHTYGTQYKRPEVTDLDVVGLAFDGDLTMRSLIAECKSPEAAAAEDLLKLLGTLRLFQTSRGYLVKERIADNAREIASKQGVSCLDSEEALHLLNSLETDATTKLDAERRGYDAWAAVISALRTNERLSSTLRYVRRDYWTREAWENLHSLIYLCRNVLLTHLDPANIHHRALIFELCRLFNISILKLCNSVFVSHLSQLDREIEIHAFGGPKSRRERERLYDEIARSLPRKRQMPNPLNPDYLAHLKEVVAYFLMSPVAASRTPMMLQQLFYQDYLGIKDMYSDNLHSSFSDITIKLAKDSSELLVNDGSGKGKEFLSQLLTV